MPSATHPVPSRRPDIGDHAVVAREDEAVEHHVALPSGKMNGTGIEGEEIRLHLQAVALGIASTDVFAERQRRTIENARALAAGLMDGGIDVLTDGTDVHLVLVDLTSTGLDGQEGEDRLDQVGITVNRNAIPFDPRPPMNPSGLRIGTPALTTRGFQPEDMTEIGSIISEALGPDFESKKDSLAARSQALMDKYPLYPALG